MSKEKPEGILKRVTTYESPMPDIDFTFVPKSEINVDQAVNGKPYWVERIVGNTRQPKKWIITDCLLNSPFADEANDVKLFYEFILNQGVECYVWTGQLTKVNDIDELMAQLRNVPIIHAEALGDVLKKQNISKKASEIIDYVYARALRRALGPLIPGMSLPSEELSLYGSSLEMQLNIVRMLKNLNIADHYVPYLYVPNSMLENIPIHDVKKISPELEVDYIYKKLPTRHLMQDQELLIFIHSEDLLNNLVKKSYPQGTPFENGKVTSLIVRFCSCDSIKTLFTTILAQEELKDLCIDNCNDIDNEQLKNLLSTLSSLESVTISGCPKITDELLLNEKKDSELKRTRSIELKPSSKGIECSIATTNVLYQDNLELVLHGTPEEITYDLLLTKNKEFFAETKDLKISIDISDKNMLPDILKQFPNATTIKVNSKLETDFDFALTIKAGNPNTIEIKRDPQKNQKVDDRHFESLNNILGGFANVHLDLIGFEPSVLHQFLSHPNLPMNAINTFKMRELQFSKTMIDEVAQYGSRYLSIFKKAPELKELCFGVYRIDTLFFALFNNMKMFQTELSKQIRKIHLSTFTTFDKTKVDRFFLHPEIELVIDLDDNEHDRDTETIFSHLDINTLKHFHFNHLAFNFPIESKQLLEYLVHFNEISYLRVDCLQSSITLDRPLENLRTLILSGDTSDLEKYNSLLKNLSSFTPNLVSLLLHYDQQLDADTLFAILNQCPKITMIRCGDIKGLSTEALATLKERFPKLVLDLLGNPDLLQDEPNWEQTSRISTLDAETGNKQPEFHVRQFFLPKPSGNPHPNNYRLQVHSAIEFGERIKYLDKQYDIKAVDYQNKLQENLKQDYEENYASTEDVFYGEITLPAQLNDWYPLPSLTTADQIMGLNANKELILGYCKEQALYYVKPVVPLQEPLHIQFLVKATAQPFLCNTQNNTAINFKDLQFSPTGELIKNEQSEAILSKLGHLRDNEKIEALRKFCRRFNLAELAMSPENGVDALNAIIKNAVGVCRHRTFVFMALAKELGIQARAVENDCHSYVEVFDNDAWYTCDLGGGPGTIKIHPMSKGDENPVITTLSPSNTISPNNMFNTWDTIPTKATNYQEYVQEIMQQAKDLPVGKRNLLVALDEDQIEAFHAHMAKYMVDNNNHFYYLPTLGDVNEHQAIIELGKLKKEPSNLFQFVANATEGDALISNWSEYKSSYVGYNTMMDEERKLKSQTLPKDMAVITLIDKNKLSEMGEDFFSRFRAKSNCPNFAEKDNRFANLALQEGDDTQDFGVAEFFNNDWENNLLGRITIHGKEFMLEEGLLVKAINHKQPGLLLRNAPWDNEKFRIFMTELMARGTFSVNGKTYHLPPNFTFKSEQKPYELHSDLIAMADASVNHSDPFILNAQTFNQFLKGMRCKDGLIYHKPGWIALHEKKSMVLYVTDNLPENAWAHLIHTAKKHQCSLQLLLAPNVTLPEGMLGLGPTSSNLLGQGPSYETQNKLITTNDLEMAEEELMAQNPQALVISINKKSQFNDLIEKPVKIPGEGDDSFAFQSLTGTVYKQLCEGQTVILKGPLSKTLAQQLETLFLTPPFLWVNGKKKSMPGKLVLLTDEANPLLSVKEEQKNYNTGDYWQVLDETYKSDKKYLKFKDSVHQLQQVNPQIQFSYGQLRSMAEKIARGHLSNPFKPFFRMNPIDPVLTFAKDAWIKEPKPSKEKDVMLRRRDKIISELAVSPYLFVVGPSGVGKSTYILNELKKENCDIHVGLENLKDWVMSKDERDQILFIDEANLEREGVWDQLEGLFNKTPGILLDGEFHGLTPNKKVIFAGNFAHFAGRVQHRYFERHGQVINFKEMPNEVLSSTIINPSLNALFPKLEQPTAEAMNELLLKVYNHINTTLPNHPFTPRNLKSICLRVAWASAQHLNGDQLLALKMAIVDEASNLLTTAERKDLENLIGLSNRDQLLQARYQNIPSRIGNMIVTPSRHYSLYLLEQQFAIRDLIINNPELSGFEIPNLLIEGLPGIGKSRMVMEYLKSLGYTEGKLNDGDTGQRNHCYYHITPTDPDTMEAILQKAFHEGAYVIIDELNTLPLERIINKLYDGIDNQGNKAQHKGFSFCATQNPITFSNREALSIAFINRLNKLNAEDYPEQELRDIALGIYNNPDVVEEIIDLYMEAKTYAIAHNKNPKPTPRDLFEYISSRCQQDVKPDKVQGKEHTFFAQPRQVNEISSDQSYGLGGQGMK